MVPGREGSCGHLDSFPGSPSSLARSLWAYASICWSCPMYSPQTSPFLAVSNWETHGPAWGSGLSRTFVPCCCSAAHTDGRAGPAVPSAWAPTAAQNLCLNLANDSISAGLFRRHCRPDITGHLVDVLQGLVDDLFAFILANMVQQLLVLCGSWKSFCDQQVQVAQSLGRAPRAHWLHGRGLWEVPKLFKVPMKTSWQTCGVTPKSFWAKFSTVVPQPYVQHLLRDGRAKSHGCRLHHPRALLGFLLATETFAASGWQLQGEKKAACLRRHLWLPQHPAAAAKYNFPAAVGWI